MSVCGVFVSVCDVYGLLDNIHPSVMCGLSHYVQVCYVRMYIFFVIVTSP